MYNLQMSGFAESVFRQKYSMDGAEDWAECANRVSTNVMAALGYSESSSEVRGVEQLIRARKFIPGGRYLYASGRGLHQTQNCLLLKAEDSREGWADLWWKSGMALMTGAGIGIDYSDIRGKGAPIKRTGGVATGPLALMHSVNELGRQVVGGGMRRSAIWAGLKWNHPDIFDFIAMKDWDEISREAKYNNHEMPLPMELTNISVILDDDFFTAYDLGDALACNVYAKAVKRMAKTGEPGFSVDVGINAGETLRNACTEVTSCDDSDICNLGSINLARIESLGEMEEVVHYSTLFLLAGTVYSHVPYPKVAVVREKNRRLGLGLMGVHEWLLTRGYEYGPRAELSRYLSAYAESTEVASAMADFHGISQPVKTRAIAPTGTIGIIGETTTGIEPIFCVAYQRRWSKGDRWEYEYVADPTAQKLIEQGLDPEDIEDVYSIGYARRVAFQAWIQQYVDHGISSTINLPAPIINEPERNAFAQVLYTDLPNLRGATVYPNGARAGQPITPVPYRYDAISSEPTMEEVEERCVSGVCSV